MAALEEVVVVAPIPVMAYSKTRRKNNRRGVLSAYRDEALGVLHPIWVYPPMGGVVNAFFLFLWLLWPIWRLRRRFAFDVIDAHFGHPEGVAAALLATVFGCPFTVTLRGHETVHGLYRWRGQAMRWALRRAARVIAVSERLRQFAIAAGVPTERTVTISNGVDATLFHPRERGPLRQRLGMRPGVTAFVSAGHLIEGKGHHFVVEALADLRARGVNAELWVVGGLGPGGDYEREIHEVVKQRQLTKVVHFCGHVSPRELSGYMAAADVFCLASLREGCPNVVNEALACGTPVVASDVGAIPEMLTDQAYGIVVPPGDIAALKTALGRAMETQWDRAHIAAWGQARSWKQVATEAVEQLRLVKETWTKNQTLQRSKERFSTAG